MWRIYASMSWVIIGSGNSLLPVVIKPLPELMMTNFQLDHKEQTPVKFLFKYGNFHHRTWVWIWVRSWNCGCPVTWFRYQLIAKPGNKTAAVSWPDPYVVCNIAAILYQPQCVKFIATGKLILLFLFSSVTEAMYQTSCRHIHELRQRSTLLKANSWRLEEEVAKCNEFTEELRFKVRQNTDKIK